MPNTLGTLPAKQDANQEYTLVGISGTLGPTYGTAEPRPLTVGENGYLNVNAAAANSTGGTLDLLKAGTITRIEGGSIAVTAGTVVVTSGTQQTLGTVGTLQAGTITRLEGGTLGLITTVSNLSAGSVAVTAGTVIVTNGTIGAGTVAISAGTVGGKAASGAAAVANPVLTAGTDAGGTVYAPLMTTTGHQLIDILSGTIQSSGTTTGVGVVTSVTNLAAGTITRLEGGTLGILSQGSINVTAGTMIMTVGTVGGKAASGAAAVANPVSIAGTDAGGTIYGLLVDTKGQQFVSAGTITKLEQGSINVTAGTVTAGSIRVTLGTVGGAAASGAAASGNPIVSAGTDAGGTVYGMLVDTKGQMFLSAGTVTRTNTIGTLELGTVKPDGRFARNILTYGTQFAATAAAYGTLVGSASVGAGTSTWVSSITIDNPAGTVLTMVGFGTALNGSSVLWRGVLGTQTAPGVVLPLPQVTNAGMTNQDLVVYTGAAGTVDVTVKYFIAV